jgi:two-component system response regulator GlrR
VEDVGDVATALLGAIGERVHRRVRLPPEARALLARRSWPGNVRELEEVLERAVAFTRGRSIRVELLEEVLADLEGSVAAIREERRRRERAEILAAIRASGGNVTRVAERFGKSRAAIYRLMERHRIPLVGG